MVRTAREGETLVLSVRDTGGGIEARHADQALIVIPGLRMEKKETAEAMDSSSGWDTVSFTEQRFIRLAEGTALLSYRFEGRRGGDCYTALMGSVYVADEGEWKLAYHQQTPITK